MLPYILSYTLNICLIIALYSTHVMEVWSLMELPSSFVGRGAARSTLPPPLRAESRVGGERDPGHLGSSGDPPLPSKSLQLQRPVSAGDGAFPVVRSTVHTRRQGDLFLPTEENGWGGCQGGPTTEPDDMVKSPWRYLSSDCIVDYILPMCRNSFCTRNLEEMAFLFDGR